MAAPLGRSTTPAVARRRASQVTTLPARPTNKRSVDDSRIIQQEEGLEDVPITFVMAKLQALAGNMLQGVESVRTTPLSSSFIPEEIECTLLHPSPLLLLPSHVLAIQFEDSTPGLLVPIHRLPWALQCPRLPLPYSRPPAEKTSASVSSFKQDKLTLPVVTFTLPSTAFAPVHSYIYSGSTSDLHSSLTTFPNEATDLHGYASNGYPEARMNHGRQSRSRRQLVASLREIEGVWRNFVALGINEDEVWEVLERAWRDVNAWRKRR